MSVAVLNTTASLSGKTLLKAEDSQTVTGSKTFDLGASPPFICVSGAAVVPNLDADKCDGEEATDFHDAAQLTGVLPVTVVGADPNADRIVFWDDSASAYAFLEPTGLASVSGTQLLVPVDRSQVCGRLSLTTGVPVTIADVTAAGTLYYALYRGNQIALYNGTAWQLFAISELSIAVPAAANQMYDVFVDYNAGTPALSLTAWTNDTTRATALTTQDGVLVLTGSTGKRYVGSVRTVTASQLNDSFALRHVWNYYYRVPRGMRVIEAADSWNYTTATWRQANASAANQLSFIVGVAEELVQVHVHALALNTGGATAVHAAVGLDSVTAPTAGNVGIGTYTTGTQYLPILSSLQAYPAVGYHYAAWLEYSTASGTTTWLGDNGAATLYQAGIYGTING